MDNKESKFYNSSFNFSYSSLNKLLYSPSIFYKEYILEEREEKLEKHLVEGKLIHCLLLEPENLNIKFKIIPNKLPTDNVRKIMHKLANKGLMNDLSSTELEPYILEALKQEDLYQSLKEDSARLAKIQCEENKEYWKYLTNPNINIIDNDILQSCQDRVNIIKSNQEIIELLSRNNQTFIEQYLECKLKNKNFGLKGYLDFYKIDDFNKSIIVCDFKTTSKSITEFKETIDYYNYWLQTAIYCKLVHDNIEESKKNYEFLYKFIVLDKYNQVYVFDVSKATLNIWSELLINAIEIANYHYTNNNYKLPYEYLVNKIVI